MDERDKSQAGKGPRLRPVNQRKYDRRRKAIKWKSEEMKGRDK